MTNPSDPTHFRNQYKAARLTRGQPDAAVESRPQAKSHINRSPRLGGSAHGPSRSLPNSPALVPRIKYKPEKGKDQANSMGLLNYWRGGIRFLGSTSRGRSVTAGVHRMPSSWGGLLYRGFDTTSPPVNYGPEFFATGPRSHGENGWVSKTDWA